MAIRNFKTQMSGEATAELEPWDEPYYTGILKSSVLDIDHSVCFFTFFHPQLLT